MEKKGLILVLITAIISGISIFVNKFGVSGINPDVFTFAKNVVVAIFLLSVILIFSKLNEFKKITKKQWLKLSAIGLIGGSIPFLLFFRGLKISDAGVGSLIHKLMFVFVAILAVMFLKEKLDWKFFVAAIVLFIGNALVLGVYDVSFGYGELLILAATLFWAAENVISKHVLKELSGNVVAFGRMFFGSLFILIFLFATGEHRLVASLNQGQVIWVLITSLLLLGYVLTWYNGLKQTRATIATQVLLIGAPITTLLNFAFFGETIAFAQAAGIFLIILTVSLLIFLEIKQPRLHTHNAL